MEGVPESPADERSSLCFLKKESRKDRLDELRDGVEKSQGYASLWHAAPAAGSSSKAMPGIAVSPVPPVFTCAPSSVPVSRWASCPRLAEKGLWSIPVPTCHSLDEGPKVPHALAPADALLQQPPVSALPVQQFCCQRKSAENGINGCTQEQSPRKPPRPYQCPPASLTQAARWQETSKLR